MTKSKVELRPRSGARALLFAALLSAAACAPEEAGDELELGAHEQELARSSNPPGGLTPAQVPQFVSVTFDDNFVAEGMNWTVELFQNLKNPNGSGNPATFDGTPARSTYYHNCTYLSHMESSWRAAVDAGHELADHTTNHLDGLAFSVSQWQTEIEGCRNTLINTFGLTAAKVQGFRAPFLKYNNNLYTVLRTLSPAFGYDTSIPSCMKSSETGGNCPWPYTLDTGSVDSADRNALNSDYPVINSHPGFWELPVATAFVPPEHQAGIPVNQFAGPGRVIAMDISMFLDAQMSKAQSLAALKNTLDLRLAGNRAPLIFVGHTHVYASNWPVSSPSTQERREVISEFLSYALSKPAVRVRPVADILAWMKNPVPLGSCTPSCSGKECGPNGCGGSCGTCPGNETCEDGVCESCVPQCSGKSCGADGCGGQCGSCPSGQSCNAAGQCGAGPCAAPAWTPNTSYAVGAEVTEKCTTEVTGCVGKVGKTVAFRCKNSAWGHLRPGTDGGWWDAWTVVADCSGACTPSCSGKQCGNDGCGGSCGTCGSGQSCNTSGQCQSVCVPQCSGKQCGSDGCGGSCGTCGSGQTCSATNQCVTSGNACSAPAWVAKAYALNEQVTATCSSDVVGTVCFGNNGKKFAFRCKLPDWCATLAPGGAAGGWWSAWESVQSCP